jgi:SOS-response transcriptional repressor LexA
MALSFKQQKFLSFVQRHTVEYGQAPSYEEIMDGMGFASLGTVHWYVNALTHNGHLDRSKGCKSPSIHDFFIGRGLAIFNGMTLNKAQKLLLFE